MRQAQCKQIFRAFQAAIAGILLLASLIPVPVRAGGPITWLESCGLGQRTQDYLVRDILLIAQAYRKLFSYRFGADFHMDIRFFCTPASFEGFLEQHLPEAAASEVVGLFLPEYHLMLISARGTDDPAATLLHETSHALLDSHSGHYRIWLHEGLAETFEYIDRQSPSLKLKPNAYAMHGLQLMYSQRPAMLDLKRYLSLDLEAWRQLDRNFPLADTAINFSRSMAWGLASFLLESPQGRKLLNKIMENARQSKPQSDLDVIAKSWPGGIKGLQNEWLRWLQRPAHVLGFPQIKL